MGQDPDTLFNLIDLDQSGEITKDEFIAACRDTLQLWLSEENLRSAFD
jgi:Ca2+-binding EF-hand superfamily protein